MVGHGQHSTARDDPHHFTAQCDGAGVIDAALGHPRVYLHVNDQTGFVDCGYCDRRFVIEGGPADRPQTS